MSEPSAVVVGASSGVGRALAEGLARAGYALVLAARDARDLEATAAHLRLRFDRPVFAKPLDLGDASFDAEKFCLECVDALGGVDAFFLTAAEIDPADSGFTGSATARRLLSVNFAAPLELLSGFGRHLEERGRGWLVVFSSIAAAAPRGRNVVYSATKAALETYCAGIRHHLASTGVRVQVYRLGYVDTSMSFGQKLLLPPVPPERVARHVLRNLRKDRGLVYYPRYWSLLLWVLDRLPWFVYKKLRF
ncbi:MAG: SDR family NAD(P)-dependent oxidoreductase [Myxococcota bacterium]